MSTVPQETATNMTAERFSTIEDAQAALAGTNYVAVQLVDKRPWWQPAPVSIAKLKARSST